MDDSSNSFDKHVPPQIVADTRERHDLDGGVTLQIERTLPENRLENLAVSLAGAYNRRLSSGKDADAFDAQNVSERRKASDMTTVIFQLKDRAREDVQRVKDGLPPIKRLRMDPLEDYDLEACDAERRQCLDRACEFHAKADGFREAVKAAEIEIRELERRVKKAQEFAQKVN